MAELQVVSAGIPTRTQLTENSVAFAVMTRASSLAQLCLPFSPERDGVSLAERNGVRQCLPTCGVVDEFGLDTFYLAVVAGGVSGHEAPVSGGSGLVAW